MTIYDIINIKYFDPNKIKLDEKTYENIFIYYIRYVTVKNSKYVKHNSVNPFHLIISKLNKYLDEINKNKYLTLVPTNESKKIIKKYEELWSKIRYLVRSITKNSDDYDEKYMKIKFDSDNELPLNKMIEVHNIIFVVRAVFLMKNKNYYSPVF